MSLLDSTIDPEDLSSTSSESAATRTSTVATAGAVVVVVLVDAVVVVEAEVVVVEVVAGLVDVVVVLVEVVVLVVDVVAAPVWYSTCSRAAPVALPSKASATRRPVPVMMTASALPLAHPGRLTISWTIAEMSADCCAGPAAPTVVHEGGLQATVAAVRARPETLPEALVKVGALSVACPARVRSVASVVASSTVNWT
jgi:hypothetical protein